MGRFRVVVCGGGVAGIEGLLRLRRLAGEAVDVTLLSPADELVYRPLAVGEPFSVTDLRRYPLERIAGDAGARLERDALASVDRARRRVRTDAGLELEYDALLLAVGGRESTPYEHAHVFSGRDADETFHGIVRDIEMGYIGSIAFVLPDGPVWPLPLYELALMTAERARSMNVEPRIAFFTAEGRPLKVFGQAAGDAVVRMFENAGVTLHTGVSPQIPARGQIRVDEETLEADRIVTLPRIRGPNIEGIPAGTDWFVPVDERCVVRDTEGRVFAAGDVSDFPVKHGGLGAQQADTAAAGIAHLVGVGERPEPFNPIIVGKLMTGRDPLYLVAHVVAGLGWRSEIYDRPPWQADVKIAAQELTGYLKTIERP